jgi:hypothetical protein
MDIVKRQKYVMRLSCKDIDDPIAFSKLVAHYSLLAFTVALFALFDRLIGPQLLLCVEMV